MYFFILLMSLEQPFASYKNKIKGRKKNDYIQTIQWLLHYKNFFKGKDKEGA